MAGHGGSRKQDTVVIETVAVIRTIGCQVG